jgi:hypothetical protein
MQFDQLKRRDFIALRRLGDLEIETNGLRDAYIVAH